MMRTHPSPEVRADVVRWCEVLAGASGTNSVVTASAPVEAGASPVPHALALGLSGDAGRRCACACGRRGDRG